MEEYELEVLKNKDNWIGSGYELSMIFQNRTLEEKDCLRLFQVIWELIHTTAIVAWPSAFDLVTPPLQKIKVESGFHYFGTVRIQGQLLGCGSFFSFLEQNTYFTFYIPLAMLERVYKIHYPLSAKENLWMKDINEYLAGIGTAVYKEFRFDVAVIGEEASMIGLSYLLDNIELESGILISDDFCTRLNMGPRGRVSPEGLWWIAD